MRLGVTPIYSLHQGVEPRSSSASHHGDRGRSDLIGLTRACAGAILVVSLFWATSAFASDGASPLGLSNAGITITAPGDHGYPSGSCPATISPDTITVALASTAPTNQGVVSVQYVDANDVRNVPASIVFHGVTYNSPASLTFPFGQTSTVTIAYPPGNTWSTLANGTQEIHVTVDFGIYSGVNTALGWDTYCLHGLLGPSNGPTHPGQTGVPTPIGTAVAGESLALPSVLPRSGGGVDPAILAVVGALVIGAGIVARRRR